jgi:hypothetical protein
MPSGLLHLCPQPCAPFHRSLASMRLPDKLKLDWWRFRMGGGWCLEGEDLAEGAGAACLGVAGTSYTGPSYMPLETLCNPKTLTEGEKSQMITVSVLLSSQQRSLSHTCAHRDMCPHSTVQYGCTHTHTPVSSLQSTQGDEELGAGDWLKEGG